MRSLRPQSEEMLVACPSPLLSATHYRSTVIASSLRSLREHGHHDRYMALLPAEHRDAIVTGAIGLSWVPMAHAIAHYRACDGLNLHPEEIMAIGSEVGERIQGTFMGTMAKKATALGVSVWFPIGQIERIWARIVQGGGVAAYKLGPTEARIELHGIPLAGIDYFRYGYAGMLQGAIAIFCKKGWVQIVHDLCSADRLAFALSWL